MKDKISYQVKCRPLTHVSRRSFLFGGAASVAALGFGLSTVSMTGCSHKTKKADNYDGVITASMAYTSTNCNPIGNTTALFCAAGWHVFESLYELDFSDYSVYNGLASGEPIQVSDTQYTINMRPGAKFSNGEEVTSADVVSAFNRTIKDELYGEYLNSIKSITAIDKLSVSVQLNFPFRDLLEKRLSLLKIFPAKMEAAELKKNPIGSGPWMYGTIDGNDGGTIEFNPNPYYNGSKPAQASKMLWNILLDDTSRTTAITEQTTKAMENAPVDNVDLIRNSGATVDFVQSVSLPFFCFNCRKTPLDDYRVRQAFHYAIDTEKLINNQMSGYATAASCILQTTHPNYHRAKDVFDYNPDKARQLLEEAGVSKLEVTMLVNNNWVSKLSSQIKNDLDKVGITANLEVAPIVWSRYAPSNDVLPFDLMLTPGDPSCFGDDADLIMTCWYGDNTWMRGRSCYKFSKDNRFDEIKTLMQQARESQGDAMQQTWNKVYDIIAEQCPIYPIFHRQVPTGYLPDYLENFKPISTTGLNFIGCKAKTQE